MVLYGKPVAEKLDENIKQKIEELRGEGIRPFLAVILVGSDPASVLYTKKKREKAENLGLGFRLHHLPADISEQNLLDLINLLNQNKEVHGILVQLPLPEVLDAAKVLAQIDPKKDVDGLNGGCPPPTVGAIIELLDFYNIELKGKKIVLVGRGKLVGQPLEKYFTEKNIEVTVCDSKTEDMKNIVKNADVVISGVGKPGLITKDMVNENMVIIDAGTAESGGASVGDVSPDVYDQIAAYSPVPGGVGPITVAALMNNLTVLAEKQS